MAKTDIFSISVMSKLKTKPSQLPPSVSVGGHS